jgi:ribosomal protein S18 acetylase RimI-like enzyme
MKKVEAVDNGVHLRIRRASKTDTIELCSILNVIIGIGGTTGFETTLNESEFESYFLEGDSYICCFLAEKDGVILGFQSLSYHPELTDDWADIATFARVNPKIRGIGTTLFETTRSFARKQKIATINATIRADNKAALSFYDKMGFANYSTEKGVPLQNGIPVDRISKKYIVTTELRKGAFG